MSSPFTSLKMKILIVEDEARIAKRIARMTQAFFGSTLTTLQLVDSLTDGLAYIKDHALDLVLLDLNLNGANGFDMLKTAVAEPFNTIIVSAQKEHALLAFEYGVLDFVPKPFNQERLEQAFRRIVSHEKGSTEGARFLAVKKQGTIQLVKSEEVLYIKGAGVYTELFLSNGQKELHDKSLEKLAQLLPSSFERIHKSYLVKMTEATGIRVSSGSKYGLELSNGEVLPIGRTRYKGLKEKWF